MINVASTSQVLPDSIRPSAPILIRKHLRHASLRQPVYSLSKILATAIPLDILDGIEISMESEHDRARDGETMKCLPLTTEECLQQQSDP